MSPKTKFYPWSLLRNAAVLTSLLLSLLFQTQVLAQVQVTTLHTFSGGDGYAPYARLTEGSDGALYGTTFLGGDSFAGDSGLGLGTVFRLNADGSGFATLHSFGGGPEGQHPQARLLQSSDGVLYGTTTGGGLGFAGTVFRLNTDGSGFEVLHNFDWSEGGEPRSGVIQGSDGSLYGTTAFGGGLGGGTVFRVNTDGSGFEVLHNFPVRTSCCSFADLIQGNDGALYGTTMASVDADFGTVFRLNTDGSGFAMLHSFSGGSDGSRPVAGLLQASDGTLFGTTNNGGVSELGTVFKLSADGSGFEVMHRFSGSFGGNGVAPQSGLVQGGNGVLYGTTFAGGDADFGTVFQLNADGSGFAMLYSFTDATVGHPNGVVMGGDGALYGTMQGNIGDLSSAGTVFRIVPPVYTPSGTNVQLSLAGATLTFSSVSTAGLTTLTPIDPDTAGQVSGGFAVSSVADYEIQTTATFSGPVTIGFAVPDPISAADFDSLAVLHNENGVLVDVTATSPARNYATRTIYAVTNSLSPFYVVRKGQHISALFDQTKAYKSGSTVPIKLQLISATNANISSAATSLTARNLMLVGGNSPSAVIDSGNANADSNFRYDSALRGYIFNLSTKGLRSGTWTLSIYAGADHSFVYLVRFEVK